MESKRCLECGLLVCSSAEYCPRDQEELFDFDELEELIENARHNYEQSKNADSRSDLLVKRDLSPTAGGQFKFGSYQENRRLAGNMLLRICTICDNLTDCHWQETFSSNRSTGTGRSVLPMLGGRYLILGVDSARFGMTSYLAMDMSNNRLQELQLLNCNFLGRNKFVDSVFKSYLASASLDVPGLARPRIVSRNNLGLPWSIMESEHAANDGLSISELLSGIEPLSLHCILSIAECIAATLKAMHEKLRFHGMLSASQIRFFPGKKPCAVIYNSAIIEPILPSTGLKSLWEESSGTNEGQLSLIELSGGYLAPESIEKGIIDERSDIYLFGGLIYELICGLPPFSRQSASDIARANLTQSPPPLPPPLPPLQTVSKVAVPIPKELSSMLMQCLSKNPEERPRGILEKLIEIKEQNLPKSR